MKLLNHGLKKYDKKKGVNLCVMFMLGSCLLLGGCGASKEETTRIIIDKDGGIKHVMYESFDKDYYNLTELSDMAAEEISYYNSEYISPKISLEDAEMSEDGESVKLVMNYASALDYSHFNQTALFYGTVKEALDKGFDVSGALVDTDGVAITEQILSDSLDKHIIISSVKGIIEAPYKITYMTKGTKCDKKEADLSDVTNDSVQLLLSK